MDSQINNDFDFIKDTNKIKLLIKANETLNVSNCNNIVFVYSCPKVGSTSIVSSLRIFGLIHNFSIIHIHDEIMLNVLTKINGISINELILYNKHIGKNIYVINIYRSPIERKMSSFFEKIGSHHFNNTDENVNNYDLNLIIKRFDNIFPHISNGDHFIDKYNIPIPNNFDWNNKYLIITNNDIKYITLRLCDSNIWDKILTNIFGFNIKIIKDYESNNKPIKNLYNNFKEKYRIPRNLLNDVLNDKHFKFYYSPQELINYNRLWISKSKNDHISYNHDQYKLYEEITLENLHMNFIQLEHYFDEGCICNACNLKRIETANKLIKGETVNNRIIHSIAKIELLNKKINKANKINNIIHQIKSKQKNKTMSTLFLKTNKKR